MKRLYLILSALLLSIYASASHFYGMDIHYEYMGTGNLYRVYLNVYAECGGATITPSESILFSSASSGISFGRNFTLSAPVDTVKEMWCPGAAASCGSSYPIALAGRFSDTVTLAPHTDWKISCTDGSRNATIVNINGPASYNIYVEAFLNNSVAPNSSAVMVGDPHFFVPGGPNIVTNPFQVMDPDGDNVTATLIQPLTAAGSPVLYASGYTLAAPFGTGSTAQINVANSTFKTQMSNLGRYTLATRASDYRNGVLVGYSSRDWCQSVGVTVNSKAPLPASAAIFTATTCPGQAASYTINFTDSVATDSVYLHFTTPFNGIMYTTSYTNGIGAASATVSWTTPSTWNPATNPHFIIGLSARDNACPMNGYGNYNIVVNAIQCNTDTVWAGDANADYAVDMYDPLAIAVAYGATGILRPGASVSWTGQYCANWTGSFVTGINYKHSDCDGSGTVNSSDLAAVTANYSLTHPRDHYTAYAKGSGLPDLYFDHTGLNAGAGATISIPLKLGSTAQPIAGLYGLAARIRITGITPGSPAVAYPASWLGTIANTLRFTKSTTANTIDWAYARTDHQAAGGQGTLANLNLTIPAGTAGQKIVLTIEDVKMIKPDGTVLSGYNVLSDTITIKPLGVSSMPSAISSALIVPNPSNGAATLALTLAQATDAIVSVTDITGRIVWQSAMQHHNSGVQEIDLPAGLQHGIYLVRINAGDSAQLLKWASE